MPLETSTPPPGKKWRRLRAPVSCDQCRIKKRKCDRQDPCSRCVSDSEACTHDQASAIKSIAREKRQAQSKKTAPHEGNHSITSSSDTFRIDQGDLSRQPRLRNEVLSSPASTTHHTSQVSTASNSIPWSSPNATSDLFTAPSSVISPGFTGASFNAHVAREPFSLERLAANDSSFQMISHAPFLTQVVEIFIREIDWIMDLLSGTRIHKLILQYPTQGFDRCSSSLAENLHVLAIAMIALTAQMCPTELQAILLTMDWPVPLPELPNVDAVSSKAYRLAASRLNDPMDTGEPKDWPAEHFAASYLLRIYEKNDGRARNTKENLLIDLYRLQQAGFHRLPLQRSNITEWQAEHDLLGYRLFWQYFDKDCVISWFGKVGRVINTQRAKICLKDPFGHMPIDQLCRLDFQATATCSCLSSFQEINLSAFVGGGVRLSAITVRFSDRVSRVTSPSFKWPEDAERLAHDFDSELARLEKDIEAVGQQMPGQFQHAQREVLMLNVAHTRCELAKTLCEAFSTILITNGTAKLTIDNILERRRLDTAMSLIKKAKSVTAKLASCSLSWIFCPMFVHEHIIVLLDNVTPWILSPGYLNESSRHYLLKCLRNILLGRNLLILLTRRNELNHAKYLVRDVCSRLEQLLTQALSGQYTEPIGDTLTVIDEESITKSFEQRLASIPQNSANAGDASNLAPQQTSGQTFSQLFTPVFDESLPNFSMDEEFRALFEDLPALSQLFQF